MALRGRKGAYRGKTHKIMVSYMSWLSKNYSGRWQEVRVLVKEGLVEMVA